MPEPDKRQPVSRLPQAPRPLPAYWQGLTYWQG